MASTVKAHGQFQTYSLAEMVGILKSHESVVTKEEKVVSSMGSLALLSKAKMLECDLTSEEYAMMVSNPKRFARKKFLVVKNRNWQGSYNSDKVKEDNKSSPPKESSIFQGEGSSTSENPDSSFKEEKTSPIKSQDVSFEGEHSDPDVEVVSSFEG